VADELFLWLVRRSGTGYLTFYVIVSDTGLSCVEWGCTGLFFFPIRPEPDFAGFGMTNPAGDGTGPDFQIDCNFTNLMCKNITNVRVI